MSKEHGGIETAHELPKHHEDRRAIAGQVWYAKEADGLSAPGVSDEEREQRYRADKRRGVEKPVQAWQNNRSGYYYISDLEGLEGSFRHVRELGSRLTLDIGTGTSRGISEIAKSELGVGLEFKGTAVKRLPEFDKNLGRDKIIMTYAEALRGVGDNSVGCILALHSISYSARPARMAARLDQVLVEGGVVKGRADFPSNPNLIRGEDVARSLALDFRALGYDVDQSESVFLAVKPYKDKSVPVVRARDLMRQDRETADLWMAKFQPQE